MKRGIYRKHARYEVFLPAEERDVLAALPGQLRAALAEDEPTVYRLFPPAYNDDPAANVEYHRLVGSDLADRKLAALAELERTAHAPDLSTEELESWLGAIESLRLVLGTQLDVTEAPIAIDRDDPDAHRWALYAWLSWLQEEVVAGLADSLDD